MKCFSAWRIFRMTNTEKHMKISDSDFSHMTHLFPHNFHPKLLLILRHIQTNVYGFSQYRGKRNGKQFNSVWTVQRGEKLKTFDILIFKKQSHTLLCLAKLTGYGSELLIEGKSATWSLSIFDIGWSQTLSISALVISFSARQFSAHFLKDPLSCHEVTGVSKVNCKYNSQR